MKPLPSLYPAEKAWFFADAARAALPGPLRAALPLPVRGAEGVLWSVWLGPSELDADTGALRLGAPRYVASFRADFGGLEELALVSPGALGLGADAGPWLGELTDAPAREAARARYYGLLAETVPSFAAGPRSLTAPIKRAAGALKDLFPEVAEPPLLPLYRRAAARFFTWLDFASTA